MIVAFDIDDTLFDEHILNDVCEEFGLDYKEISKDLYSLKNMPGKALDVLKERFMDSSYNANPELLPGSLEAIEGCRSLGYDVALVTARNEVISDITKRNVYRFFGNSVNAGVFFTNGQPKGEVLKGINAVAVIDDAVHHLQSASEVGVKPILISTDRTTWNHIYREMLGITTIYSLYEAPLALRRILGNARDY